MAKGVHIHDNNGPNMWTISAYPQKEWEKLILVIPTADNEAIRSEQFPRHILF